MSGVRAEQSKVRQVLAALDATGKDGTFTQPGFYEAYTRRTGRQMTRQNVRVVLLEGINRHGFFEMVRQDEPTSRKPYKFYRVTDYGRAFVAGRANPGPIGGKAKVAGPQNALVSVGPVQAKAVWIGSPDTFDYRKPYNLAGVFTDEVVFDAAAGRAKDAGHTVFVDDVVIHTYQGGQYMLVGDTAWPVAVNALLFDVPKALRSAALKSLRPEQLEALKAVGVDLSSLSKVHQP